MPGSPQASPDASGNARRPSDLSGIEDVTEVPGNGAQLQQDSKLEKPKMAWRSASGEQLDQLDRGASKACLDNESQKKSRIRPQFSFHSKKGKSTMSLTDEDSFNVGLRTTYNTGMGAKSKSQRFSINSQEPEEPPSSCMLCCMECSNAISRILAPAGEVYARALQPFILSPDSNFKSAWNTIVSILLIYIGTIFPYRLCFIDFRVEEEDPNGSPGGNDDVKDGWYYWGLTIDILFWVDLALNFLSAYRDKEEKIVNDPRRIASAYFSGWFFLDLLACLPTDAFKILFVSPDGEDGDGGQDANANKAVRLTRMYKLNRLTRLTRLVRITRLLKIVKMAKSNAVFRAITAVLGQSRGAMLMKFVLALLFVMHILACGWYLVAYLVGNPEETWVVRRDILLEPPDVHYAHAMYFVFTVFTTVGLGDIYAVAISEIYYVIFLQLLGSVLQSIIVTEMIKVLTWVDAAVKENMERRALVSAYCEHCQMNEHMSETLQRCLEKQAPLRPKETFDRHAMAKVLKSKLSRNMQETIPQLLFQGEFTRNKFFSGTAAETDNGLILLMSVYINKRYFHPSEIVYRHGDNPNYVYLISSGTIAAVAIPTRKGGTHDSPQEIQNVRGNGFASRLSGLTMALESWELAEQATYALYGKGAYFGEWEMVNPSTREATMRSETQSEAMMLTRHGFVVIGSEHPQFLQVVKKRAAISQRRLAGKLRRLVESVQFRDLAASLIQAYYRGYRVRQDRRKAARLRLKGVVSLGKFKEEGLAEKLKSGDNAIVKVPQEEIKEQPKPKALCLRDIEQFTKDVSTMGADLKDVSAKHRKVKHRQQQLLNQQDLLAKHQQEVMRMMHQLNHAVSGGDGMH